MFSLILDPEDYLDDGKFSVVPWNFFLLPSPVAQHENSFSTNEVCSEKDCSKLIGINTCNFMLP